MCVGVSEWGGRWGLTEARSPTTEGFLLKLSCRRIQWGGRWGLTEARSPTTEGFLLKLSCWGIQWGGRWGLNPRPPESQSGALPTELRPPLNRSISGAPDRNRTCNPRLRRPVLYPIELRAQNFYPVDTRSCKLVGVERFELPTSCSQSRRATRLRYTPI